MTCPLPFSSISSIHLLEAIILLSVWYGLLTLLYYVTVIKSLICFVRSYFREEIETNLSNTKLDIAELRESLYPIFIY